VEWLLLRTLSVIRLRRNVVPTYPAGVHSCPRKRGLDKSSTAAVSPLKKSAKETVKLGSADG